MRRVCSITVLLIALLPATLDASPRLFHVVGSYSQADNANREQQRLKSALGVPVRVHFDDRQAVYRVIIDAAQVNPDQLKGIDSWLLAIDAGDEALEQSSSHPSTAVLQTTTPEEKIPQVVLSPPEETSQTVRTSDPASMGPLYPAFEPGETLSAYCDRLPDSRLCLHPRMQRAIEQDRKLAAHRAAVANACEAMSDPERRTTCEQLRDTE